MFKFLFQGSNLIARTAAQFAVVGMAGTIGVTVASTSASASLDAIASNGTAQAIASGTLSLTQAAGASSSGFSSTLTAMAPGDSLNYYVNYTNGTMGAQNLYLSITDDGNTLLTRDATKGLKVTVAQCTVAWTSGACTGGTATTLVGPVAISTINTSGSGSEATIWTGNTAASSVKYLKFTLLLPDQTETVTNGVLPGGTIQGLSTGITWKMREIQRAATSTEG
jgi:hypothetical protein